jgi:hypothetical protein
MTPFLRRDLGRGDSDLRGTMFIFCPAMMFVVDRNSVKYALHTRNHTPRGRGYDMKNRACGQGLNALALPKRLSALPLPERLNATVRLTSIGNPLIGGAYFSAFRRATTKLPYTGV